MMSSGLTLGLSFMRLVSAMALDGAVIVLFGDARAPRGAGAGYRPSVEKGPSPSEEELLAARLRLGIALGLNGARPRDVAGRKARLAGKQLA